ncbi:MAG: iron-containing redox enzyme family protein, partial [Sciscionella sp.]
FFRSLERFGLDLPVIPVWEDWRPYAGHNLYFLLGCNRRHLFKALGSLAMPELFDVDRDEVVVRGMQRLGFSPHRDFEFFVNHMEGDAEHGLEWLDGVVLPIVRNEPDAGLELMAGGALRMLAMRRYNEYLAENICRIDVAAAV